DEYFTFPEPLGEDGQFKIEEYNKIIIYEPTKEKQASTWDTIS
ncbi:20084_t:CDS:1, partial [Gigaspora rosea]